MTLTFRVTSDTLVLVNSSSGETPTIKLYVEQAAKQGAEIITFTDHPASSLAGMSTHVVDCGIVNSTQIMKSLNEQFSFLLFDFWQIFTSTRTGLIEWRFQAITQFRNSIMKTHRLTIGSSIICMDHINFERDVKLAEKIGVDYLHVDVMDGALVPRYGVYPRSLVVLPISAI